MATVLLDAWNRVVDAYKEASSRQGVLITHGNLHQNVDGIRELLGDDFGDTAERIWSSLTKEHGWNNQTAGINSTTRRSRINEVQVLIEALSAVK